MTARREVTNPEEYTMETRTGGWGRLIAFTIVDSVNYEYKDGNILTITKTILLACPSARASLRNIRIAAVYQNLPNGMRELIG